MSCHAYQRELGLIIPATTIAAGSTIESPIIECTGFNQLTLEINLVYAAATNVRISAIEVTDVLSGTVAWRNVQSVSVSSGVGTCTDLSYVKATGAGDVDFAVNIPLNYKAIKLSFTTDGGTTDTIAVRGRLGVV